MRDEKKRNRKSEKKKDVGSSCLYLRVPPQFAASQTVFYLSFKHVKRRDQTEERINLRYEKRDIA